MTAGRKRRRHERDASSPDDDVVVRDGLVRRDLLRHAYATVLTLREYALFKLPSSSRLRRKKISSLGQGNCADEHELEAVVAKFLDSTLICSSDTLLQTDNTSYEQWLAFSQKGDDSHITISGGISECEGTQSELVDWAIWSLFNREKTPGTWPKHLLCDGFRKRSKEGDPPGTFVQDVYSLYPNHHSAALRQKPWPQVLALLGRSGQKVMVDLLIERSIFVAIDAGIGNYYQISGIPVSELELSGSRSNPNQPRKPSEITLIRSRIFYAKPALAARGRVQPGFKPIHVLNRCRAAKNDGTSCQVEKIAANTMKVTMHIFPRQFGLHNVFTSNVNVLETAQKFHDYTLREKEIKESIEMGKYCSKDGTPKLPKRLRGEAWRLVQRLQVLHSRCSYGELLQHYCPRVRGLHADESSHPLDERRQIMGVQRSIEPTVPIAANDCQEKCRASRSLQDDFECSSLVELATSHSQVSAFCQAVFSHIVPNDFWGKGEAHSHNKAVFLRNVDHFVKLRRFEALTLHEICQGMKLANIQWLQPPGLEAQKAGRTDVNKRCELFHEFLYFVFDSLLIPLIQANFYVTESNTHRYQVFYFRHDIWRRIAEPTLSILKTDMFEEMTATEADEILRSRYMGFSEIRLLPRERKLRPIMNLRRKQACRTGAKGLKPSINSVLRPVYTTLKFEKMTNPQRLASTLFSVGDMYAKLKTFKRSLSGGPNHFFFAKVDVQSAFDTIPQDAIVQLMKTVPSQPKYTITKHAEVQPGERSMTKPKKTATKPIRRWHASALAQGQQPFLDRLRNGIASTKKNTIFVDGVAQREHSTTCLIQLLTDHVKRNLVKIGSKYYCQKRGIPQGSVLSSFLCNYFYADLERKHLGFLQGQDCLLMRLIDDFLLITLDKSKAVRFLETMHQGVPEYGVQVSPGKTLVNFDVQINGKPVGKAGTTGFPYCGTRINVRSLDMTKDVEAGAAIQFFYLQSHLMYFDTSHNAPRTVLDSLRSAFVETARKMWAYIRCLPRVRRPSTALITGTELRDGFPIAPRCLAVSTALTQSQLERRRLIASSVAYSAFLDVLSKKQANYGPVIMWLKAQKKII
ncbi:telomerase reverse transcriptase [Metarhizium album ARSEF 1941]|uniref:Telomerase reverse transcriptase n=1 Tax=Metarhizium album (strain ARSEF 1941) TaxID=1081103 RepID=A0A0B2WUV8_METAS|nr:telomerase reverse transcriptase [Metarhizium album ARSEF 1941]KHN99861.1 telomerase reverse transcriptase [Metarhizium album ARSEF 1941]